MTAQSLFEECHNSIERSHEVWKSYFSKWESLAKYEEDIPEGELINEPTHRRKSAKSRAQPTPKPSKIITTKKSQNSRRVIKKKKILTKRQNEVQIAKQYEDEDLLDDVNNKQLETILKSVLMNILQTNRNKIEVFAVLSQTFSQGDSSFFNHQTSHFQFNNSFSLSTTSRSICPARNTVIRTPPGVCLPQTSFLYDYPAYVNHHRLLPPVTLPQKINFGICSPENAKLKPLEWDFRHKSPDRVCRKINKEYFIKRSFPEMNITQDGKRFGSLCLRKRTNSVSLSMENSNFITPERKPSERKCFSENVLQRKRRRPSKVFFDNEVEDSESDDQTENRAPIIHSQNKKFKPEIIQEGAESDSDDCESIFDRVKTD